ncbi:hypothetical protein BH11PSE12_BH11PSE12_04040 [soil metagenome]
MGVLTSNWVGKNRVFSLEKLAFPILIFSGCMGVRQRHSQGLQRITHHCRDNSESSLAKFQVRKPGSLGKFQDERSGGGVIED